METSHAGSLYLFLHYYVSALSSKDKYFCQQMATVANSEKENSSFSHVLQNMFI